MANFKIDISNDNFNNLFARYAEKLTEGQKELLPKEIYHKLFKKGGNFRLMNSARVPFLMKLFVLIRCLKMNWVLLVEHEDGLGPDQFFQLKDKCRDEGFGVDPSESWLNRGMFALSNKELMDGASALNKLSVSHAYNYVSKVKNLPKSKTYEWKKMATSLIRFISNYEAKKKKITAQAGLTVPELYTLFYLYDGDQKSPSAIYAEKYKYAYNASRNQIQTSFITLENKGLISKQGKTRHMKLSITAAGVGIVDDILDQHLRDF